jgi:hypothetical protein
VYSSQVTMSMSVFVRERDSTRANSSTWYNSGYHVFCSVAFMCVSSAGHVGPNNPVL